MAGSQSTAPLKTPRNTPNAEPPAPQDAANYVKAGPGSWQPLGLVIERVLARLPVDIGDAS